MSIHSKKVGLFIGRFQPFHLGHLSAVKQALEQIDFLTIGIGSSQYSGTDENPFTADQRQKMIELALDEAGIPRERYEIRFIPDIHDSPNWPAHVKKIVPEFDTLFLSNRGLVDQLFAQYAPEVKRVQLKHEVHISGTQIREKMKRGEDWGRDVSPAVFKYLNALKT